MKRTFQFALAILLIVIFALPASGIHATQVQAASGDHFRPSSPTPLGVSDDNLRTPADFEAAAAAHPNPAGQILVSAAVSHPLLVTYLYTAPSVEV